MTALAVGGGGAAGVAATTATTAAATAAAVSVAPQPLAKRLSTQGFAQPPTTSECEAELNLACYSPQQFQDAYDLNPLYSEGLDGTGQTIVIVDSYGYQHIRSELAAFDAAFDLPAPPSFNIIQPAGPVPPFDPTARPQMIGWAEETSLDVQYAHAMAPGANILLVETPTAETLGAQGFPQIVEAENYVIDNHLGNVISQSFAAPEQGFKNAQQIYSLRSAYINAAQNGVTVLAGSGDAGASGAKTLDSEGFAETYFKHRVTSWPSTDPLVTAVGGTQLFLNDAGDETAPPTTWNDTALFDSPAASGGGVSSVFPRPAYQNGVASLVGRSRGIPDISLSAAVNGAALVFLDQGAAQGPAGFYLIGGTSEATPEFAGIVSIADQAAGHGLGLINPKLYQLESEGAPGLVDVTSGTNTVTFPQGGQNVTVNGYDAKAGYDLATGVGTVDAANLVPELAGTSTASAAKH